MASAYQKPYLDSSVFVSWIKGEVIAGVDRTRIASHILKCAERGDFVVHTSTLTLAEVHKLRKGPILPEDEDQKMLAYFENDFIQLIDVDRSIGEHANSLCRKHGLYPNDAIHLACALRARCDVLLAWDNRFVKAQHPDIPIEEPRLLGQANFGLSPR